MPTKSKSKRVTFQEHVDGSIRSKRMLNNKRPLARAVNRVRRTDLAAGTGRSQRDIDAVKEIKKGGAKTLGKIRAESYKKQDAAREARKRK